MKAFSLLFFLLPFFFSCSSIPFLSSQTIEKTHWTFNDAGINYALDITEGFKKNRYIKKEEILDQSGKLIEKRKTVSVKGALKSQKIGALRPEYSYLEVWIDKVQFGTVLKLNKKTRSFDVTVQNEKGIRTFSAPFPKSTGLFCFHQQIISCINVTGFLDKAIKLEDGKAKVNIIWEGAYLYHKLYEYYPVDLFTPATFEYAGKNEKGLHRFNLNFGDQTIFYLLDDDRKLKAMYWINQALSIEPMKKSIKQKKGN